MNKIHKHEGEDLYTDEPIQIGERVEDFLPPPEELVFKKANRKVTITLDQGSIDFFKAEAKRLNVPYQRMIRNLLIEYANRRQHRPSP
jgi:hypothetical protein